MMRTFLAPAAILLLAACSGGGNEGAGEGTSVTLNATGDEGGISAKGGHVTIDTPVFQGSFKLPKIKLDSENFDINGVKLPPGSTISAMNIDGNPDDDRKGGLRVTFQSPMAASAVRDWFAPKLEAAGYQLVRSGNALKGTTDENKPFALTLEDAGNGKSTGEIRVGG